MQSAFQPDSPPASPPPGASPRSVGLAELFTGFLSLGLMSFGGALPFARRTIVDERKWLSADEFTDLLGLCQFLPGGNVINLSVALGMRFRGLRGALAGIRQMPNDVRMRLGRPANVFYVPWQQLQVWNYRFPTGDCVWFQVSLNQTGRVTESSMGTDPACDGPNDRE